MGDNTLRHVISLLGTVAFLIVFFVGYVSGTVGWWITVVGVLFLYPIIYKLVDV